MRQDKNVLPAQVNSVVVLVFSAAVKGLCVLPSIKINLILVVRTYISRSFHSVRTLCFLQLGRNLGKVWEEEWLRGGVPNWEVIGSRDNGKH